MQVTRIQFCICVHCHHNVLCIMYYGRFQDFNLMVTSYLQNSRPSNISTDMVIFPVMFTRNEGMLLEMRATTCDRIKNHSVLICYMDFIG